ncbi:heterokaryon incompatibility protein-domain-containing protein, partial [Bisporella sp. PMI_857]
YGPLVTGSDTYPIRLLKLFPAANFATEIKYELLHARLEDQPEFEALSYEWGEDKHNPSTPIFVHGNTYYVTKNLQIIWADAICINQYDTEERAQQVSQMRKIYDVDGARRVLVWLGEEGSAKLDLDFSDKISIRNATGKDSEN